MVSADPVLIVDDQESSARALAELLADAGHTALTARSGEEGLRLIDASPPAAVLLDVEMPGLSGPETLRRIREHATPLELPVIMVTAHDASGEIAAALRAGANDYVTKPVDLDVLLARLETHLRLRALARLERDFLRIASHDLKNPLTAVIGNAELILGARLGSPVDEELRDSARAIQRRAAYMYRLINDFLDLQAARAGELAFEPAPVPLAALAAEIARDQRDYAAAREVTIDTGGGEPVSARADAARLTQVLHNLVGNAIKYSRAGGRVSLVTGRERERAVIEVIDSGPGLGPAPQQVLAGGGSGARARGGERSSGIGLQIARALVEAQGGTLSARDRPAGGGACFRVELPLSEPLSAPP